ncbi:tRNA (adenosine(37)-N6)-dimethylallyltransferase MiaA [Patescibacteria group bacterium]
MNKVIVICGPTATGKTSLALSLAKKFNGELVSADSRQIYRYMDIGTGKDLPIHSQQSKENIKCTFQNNKYLLHSYIVNAIPFWMYDVVDPDEEFSVAHYHTLATAVISDIHSRKKIPIIVGGTGLYISSILGNISTLNIQRDQQLRDMLETYSVQQLQNELLRIAPDIYHSLNNSDQQNPRRLIRKIEIAMDKNYAVIDKCKYTSLCIGLEVTQDILSTRISERVQKRIDQGMVKEIVQLKNKGYSWKLPSLSSMGYREFGDWIQRGGNISTISKSDIERIMKLWLLHETQYAKRQMTWFKKQNDIHWYSVENNDIYSDIEAKVGSWYTD